MHQTVSDVFSLILHVIIYTKQLHVAVKAENISESDIAQQFVMDKKVVQVKHLVYSL